MPPDPLYLLFTGFVVPHVVAIAAFPLLVKRGAAWLSIIPLGSCLLVVAPPWMLPAGQPLLRFLASVSAATVAIKVVDAWLDARRGAAPSWREYLAFLANPFVLVRRCLPLERRPLARENLSSLASGSIHCAIGMTLLAGLFSVNWDGWPFLAEHVSKVAAFMLAIVSGLQASTALWRLCGGTARDYMDRPFSASTPAEFWRRYNRNVQQFFWQRVFKTSGGLRAPIRTTLLIFALSALMHEFIFGVSIGRVQGYQAAFFGVQGLAAALTARVRVKGWATVPWVVGTLAFNLASSVLFFASIHAVVPFYARGLPAWLWHL